MKLHYTRKELDRIYNGIVESAYKYFNKGNIAESLNRIQLAGSFEYNINSFYSDERLNCLMSQISDLVFGDKCSYQLGGNHVLFYDSFGLDNKGLTQQYLDALLYNNTKLLYVIENSLTERSENIHKFLTDRGVKIVELGNENIMSKIKKLHEVIIDFKPSISFFHLTPSTPVPIVTFFNFPQVAKCQINLTDHAFWLGGGSFFDFSYEFRSYGCKVSIEKRGFNQNQINFLPYYPWTEKEYFEGFPIDISGKIVLFSGASMYKVVDKRNTFFHIIRKILEDNPNTIMFFAGDGNTSYLDKLVTEFNLQKRFFHIGLRHDITEVFKRCDIYIGTYPFSGGLMTQYAALFGKPIVAYKTHEIEDLLLYSNDDNYTFVYDKIDEMITEVKKLIDDEEYRKSKGAFFQRKMGSQELFRENFRDIKDKRIKQNYVDVEVDYDRICNKYIELINNNNNSNLEKQVAYTSFSLLNWKMAINILLNTDYLKFLRRLKILGA